MTLDKFTTAYIEAALWSSMDESTPAGGQPMDANYTITDIQDDVSLAGHDFWLTRNHHGAGFWDGDWPECVGEKLTEASHSCGEMNLYIGDDGRVYS
jgi:hypothetical protein